jgi:hypothetical protein
MLTRLAALLIICVTFSAPVQAEPQIDSVGAGYWFDQGEYIEIYQETDFGLHPQLFLGTSVIGISVKTDPLIEKYGVEVAPYFGLGAGDSLEGLLGAEFSKDVKVANKRLTMYFRLNIDFDNTDFMGGVRYFFDSE